ncbi:glutamine--fructose-6-phosphate transaminase (isomerizing) [Haliovirga abyssi]|uniref:Glutamine--fructose-6-phosphate aminotransferase [isomerizing] n=1 Tax=Haliovirga abyssi TaxID=2996794 RepID=A0AAU9DW82_9FUSO|nr:glutamine--fructose-6-phosphate transaminase (isomerizing) [Haliovirga abyssi]BDU50521.1 glutamine--fructose-6-phosphate aminotransferase [Haliovirga abyssi]
MCGIVGYIGDKAPKTILYNGLAKLEYRGYDSAGIAIIEDNKIELNKAIGKLDSLGEILNKKYIQGNIGIGHTRWATHGKPTVLNAHPHLDCNKELALVHNGIIENYRELKDELIKKGHKFVSETDTEVIVHLIEEYYTGDLFGAVKKAVKYLEGAYALGVISLREQDKIIAARKGSPLVIGLGENENMIASDIPAVLEHTKKVIFLDDGELAILTKEKVVITDLKGNEKIKEITEIDWSIEMAEKNGYDHFMLKEIYEQPRVVEDTLRGKITDSSVKLDGINLTKEDLEKIEKINIVACGTSYHAGLVGKYLIEQNLRIPTEVDVASEFRYKDPILSEKNLVIVISQSGETADTLAGLREAKKKGAKVIGIINVVGSTITRESDGTIYTNAGPEIGVASTKAFVSQLTALYLFLLYFGEERNILSLEKRKYIVDGLKKLPEMIAEVLKRDNEILKASEEFKGVNSLMFIGRNINYPIALEGALKLKEISYIHAEGYPAGELKHGPIALIEEEVPTVAIAVKSDTYDKVISNIQEIKARSGKIIAVATDGDEKIKEHADIILRIHEVDEIFSPILTVLPLQLLAYHISNKRGLDVDKPRNLAKSVTVE